MKREIKFRELLSNGQWHLWGLVEDGIFKGPSDPKGVHCQFTGLLDKNSVEIYEGDILKISNGSINGMLWMEMPRVVEREINGWTAPRYCWNKDGSTMDSTHWCEVIGNVHQHPELLKP